MRRFHRHRHDGSEVALANFALTFAKALLVFCVVLFLMITSHTEGGIKQKAEYIVTVDWNGSNGKYDVDTWTKLPDDAKVMFTNKESGVVYLERDDLGGDCAATTANAVPTNACEEITVIRGIVPGPYQIALHLYSFNGTAVAGPATPIQVQIAVRKLNPDTTLVWQGIVTLTRIRQEMPVVRFVINGDGKVTDFITDDLPPIIYDGSKAAPSEPSSAATPDMRPPL